MLRIGGLQKFSLIDYPGKVAAVVFTQGCDFRCPFCHNPELVLPDRFSDPIDPNDILEFLKKRQGQLQGVVVSGGEPTLHSDLPKFLKKIKDLGYGIKLDTNGNNPSALKILINERLVDYIAMDIKAPLEKYSEATGMSVNADNIQKSIDLILGSGLDHQMRTTVVKAFLSEQDIMKTKALASKAKNYCLQRFVYHKRILDRRLLDQSDYTVDEFETLNEQYSQSTP